MSVAHMRGMLMVAACAAQAAAEDCAAPLAGWVSIETFRAAATSRRTAPSLNEVRGELMFLVSEGLLERRPGTDVVGERWRLAGEA